MERLDFIKRIFDFFQIKDDSKGVLLENYDIALSVNYKVDWYRLYYHIIKNAEKNIRPMPKAILDLMPRFKKSDIASVADEGDTIIISFKNGKRYDFTISADANTSVKNIIAKNWKPGENGRFTNKIKKIVQVPKGICLLNNRIFFNDDISEEEQKILKSKIKILWDNKKAEYMKGVTV